MSLSSSHNDRDQPYTEPQARSQLLWTAIVAAILGWVALDQATTPHRGRMEPASPATESHTADRPESGFDFRPEIPTSRRKPATSLSDIR